MSTARTIPYAVLQRLRLIDAVLQHAGIVHRGLLVDYFGISVPQASLDLKQYRELAPANAVYDHAHRAHVRLPGFVRVWP